MQQSQATAANLRAELARQRISGRELARRLHKPPMWTQRRLAGTLAITLDDLALICGALDIPMTSVIENKAA